MLMLGCLLRLLQQSSSAFLTRLATIAELAFIIVGMHACMRNSSIEIDTFGRDKCAGILSYTSTVLQWLS